jgi:hypothetical protein
MSVTVTIPVAVPQSGVVSMIASDQLNLTAPLPERPDDVVRPDIEWMPSYQTYLDRVERLAKWEQDLPKTVPDGWPIQVDLPRVWSGVDFKDTEKYVLKFTGNEIVEIEAALAHFKGGAH